MLSRRIRKARKNLKLSQDDLSKKVGLSRTTINHWESGYAKPKNDFIPILAQILGVTVDWLLDPSDNEMENTTEPKQEHPEIEINELHNLDKKVGERLKYFRLRNELNQGQVAEKLNLSRQAISNYELGLSETSYETLMKMSDLYNVSIDELLGNKTNDYVDSLEGWISEIILADKKHKEMIKNIWKIVRNS